MNNIELRVYMGNVTQVQIAQELNVSKMTVSRWFAEKEMNPVRRQRVKDAIDAIRERERNAEHEALNSMNESGLFDYSSR